MQIKQETVKSKKKGSKGSTSSSRVDHFTDLNAPSGRTEE